MLYELRSSMARLLQQSELFHELSESTALRRGVQNLSIHRRMEAIHLANSCWLGPAVE
jgi:hypothetical protein